MCVCVHAYMYVLCLSMSSPPSQDELTTRVLGHQLRVVRLARPKTCDVCSEIIWQDGLVCGNCQLTLHCESCEGILDSPCAKEGDDVRMMSLVFC